MSDGVLKSDPDAVWNYVVSLNENKEYVDEAVKGAKDALESLLQRLNQKRSSIADKRSEWEDQIRFYADESESEQDPKKQEDYRKKIEEAKARIRKLDIQDEEIISIIKKIPDYVDLLTNAQRRTGRSFTKSKRILNAYLKMVEEYNVMTRMRECGYSETPGKYGVMQFRGTTFYCSGSAYAPTEDNLKRMEKGRAPIGYDGDPIELHHLIQSESGSVVEISGSMHRENHKTLHINTSDIPSGINRSSFQMLRSAYWKRRAQTLRKEMRK